MAFSEAKMTPYDHPACAMFAGVWPTPYPCVAVFVDSFKHFPAPFPVNGIALKDIAEK